MNRLYINIITFLYFIINISYSEVEHNIKNSIEKFNRGIISESILKQLQNFSLTKMPINKFKNVVNKKASCIVLIYTISDNGKDKENFYNSSMKPRKTKDYYKYGVTCGVVLSPDGIVATTYVGTMNSDRYIVSIDSDKNQSDELYGEIELNYNTYEAHLLKAFPELNLVFLKINTNKSESFEYIDIANDKFLTARNGNTNHLLYNAIAIGKCKGEHFVRKSLPSNNKNKFDMITTVIGNMTYKIIEGIPTLVLSTPLTCEGSLPENHGGAILDEDGKLLGMPIWIKDDYTTSLPLSFAIPASTIKKCFGLIEHNNTSETEEESLLCIKVEPLNKGNKVILKEKLQYITNSLKNKITDYLNNNLLASEFSKLDDFVDNNQLGVIVTGIKEGSNAHKSGINIGDIIFMFNNDCVINSNTFHNLEAYNAGVPNITLTLVRKNKVLTMEIRK